MLQFLSDQLTAKFIQATIVSLRQDVVSHVQELSVRVNADLLTRPFNMSENRFRHRRADLQVLYQEPKLDAELPQLVELASTKRPTQAAAAVLLRMRNPAAAYVPPMLRLLASGRNVIATMITVSYRRHLGNGEAFREQVEEACRKGNSTLLVTEIDPYFTYDAAAFALSSLVGEINQINTRERLDYGSYPGLDMMKAMDFGARPETLSATAMDNIRLGWGGSSCLLAEAFDVTIDDVRVDGDIRLAKETYTCGSDLGIEQGTIEALKFRVTEVFDGLHRFIINHVTHMGQEAAPDWRHISREGGHGIEVDSFPRLRGKFPSSWHGGSAQAGSMP